MNILIVDDVATNRKLLRITLEAEGHAILEAGDGVDALQILAHKTVDAVISDILMPNMDGFCLCHEIRKSEKLHDLPFIIYSATYTSPQDIKLARSIGADKYLTKPSPTEAMLQALHEVVGQARSPSVIPVAPPGEADVLKQYSQALVNKLQEKNAELQQAFAALQEAHVRIVELNAGLEMRVCQRTAELEATSRDLTRRNHEIQNFYHTLSHELKTPLTSAREFISIVKDGLEGVINEKQSEYLRYAQESCDQLTVCMDDLLDATRLDTGKLAVHMKRASLADLVKRVALGQSSAAAARQIKLVCEVEPGLSEVSLDETRIAQVITNLITNALKFTAEGGAINVSVALPFDRPGFLQVAVKDSGTGIPPEELDLIFERLYQIKSGDAATEKGLGLGLYICRELVLLHGGQIWVQSTPGLGSTFNFTLPTQTKAGNGNILVVDDDSKVRDSIRSVLERAGFVVRTAGGGVEALELMEHELPALVVLDLEMPKMDGAATLKMIRDTWGNLPVVIHTGFPGGDLMDRALEASPFTVLTKPCPAEKLVETVRRARQGAATEFWKRNQITQPAIVRSANDQAKAQNN